MKSGDVAASVPSASITRPAFLDRLEPCDPANVSVLVLMGGPSAEREVSLMSGREVSKALRRSGFLVREMDLGGPAEIDRVVEAGSDVTFIALHGTFGEDGTLQAMLDERGVLYTGSGSQSSRLAMDKLAAKKRFVAAGLATPEWRVVHRDNPQQAAEAVEALGRELVVKPLDEGSSVAVTIATDEAGYRQGLERVFQLRPQALVERRIVGRELTVGVLADEALPIVEIIPAHAFYDYQSKYFDDATRYVVDPEMSAPLRQQVQQVAAAAHRALGCRDFSRPDVLLDADGVSWVLEVNTIPGFTTHSLLPKSAAAAGVTFDALCRNIIELAMARREVPAQS